MRTQSGLQNDFKINHLIDKLFGCLMVISKAKNKNGKEHFNCVCSCGRSAIVSGTNLIHGGTKSCGHLRGRKFGMPLGTSRGALVLIKRLPGGFSEFRCKCGKTKVLRNSSFKRKDTQQLNCGCTADRFFEAREIFKRYKRNAKRLSRKFNLPFHTFNKMLKQNCHYCGVEPYARFKLRPDTKFVFMYNGVDRTDNTKGYYVGNVVTACRVCNRAKSIIHGDEFINWIERLAKHKAVQKQTTRECHVPEDEK